MTKETKLALEELFFKYDAEYWDGLRNKLDELDEKKMSFIHGKNKAISEVMKLIYEIEYGLVFDEDFLRGEYGK